MSPVQPKTLPDGRRSGRIWVILLLLAGILGLAVGIFGISTREPSQEFKDVNGVGDMQRIFGGVRQFEDRLGVADAPVQVQYFVDVQSSTYADQFLETIPPIVTTQVRNGDVQLLLRNRSLTVNATERSFYGIQAAAEQGYGWQYAYLMVRNQEAAKEARLDDEFLETIAGGIRYLDIFQWKEDFDEGVKPDSEMTRGLEDDDKQAIDLKITDAPAFLVSGPAGTEMLMEAPDLQALEQAIDKVR
ncbi:MAG: thioredoxin domain-containing protein [Solirubrobacterales bacterium]